MVNRAVFHFSSTDITLSCLVFQEVALCSTATVEELEEEEELEAVEIQSGPPSRHNSGHSRGRRTTQKVTKSLQFRDACGAEIIVWRSCFNFRPHFKSSKVRYKVKLYLFKVYKLLGKIKQRFNFTEFSV